MNDSAMTSQLSPFPSLVLVFPESCKVCQNVLRIHHFLSGVEVWMSQVLAIGPALSYLLSFELFYEIRRIDLFRIDGLIIYHIIVEVWLAVVCVFVVDTLFLFVKKS